MALNIATLALKVAPLHFEFAGEPIKANWYPNKLTPAFRAQLNRLDDEGSADEQAHGSAVKMVSILLAPDWDVMAGDEPFLPIDGRNWYDTLILAPQSLITATIKAINSAMEKPTTAETES